MKSRGENSRITTAHLIEIAAVAVVAACWGAYRLWGHRLVEYCYDQQAISFFVVPYQVRSKASVDVCYEWGSLLLGGFVVATITLTMARLAMPEQIRRLVQALPRLALSWGFPLVAAATLLVIFNRIAFEGPWYRIEDAMLLQVDPPFRHRILFVMVAWACEWLVPALSHQQAFLASQMVAAVLAVLATQAWCRRVATPRFSFFGVVLMCMMLAPTFQYYTFYDFGIVLFYALCFTLLSSRRYVTHVAAVAIGTLNHEIMLFVIPISGCIMRAQGASWRRAIGFVVLQLAVYASTRSALFWWMPADKAWLPGKVWINIDFLVHFHYLSGTLVLLSWFAIAILVGARAAPCELSWGILLLPMLLAMTLLVGQINEARQFVAFVPVAVGLILSRFDRADQTDHDDGATPSDAETGVVATRANQSAGADRIVKSEAGQ